MSCRRVTVEILSDPDVCIPIKSPSTCTIIPHVARERNRRDLIRSRRGYLTEAAADMYDDTTCRARAQPS